MDADLPCTLDTIQKQLGLPPSPGAPSIYVRLPGYPFLTNAGEIIQLLNAIIANKAAHLSLPSVENHVKAFFSKVHVYFMCMREKYAAHMETSPLVDPAVYIVHNDDGNPLAIITQRNNTLVVTTPGNPVVELAGSPVAFALRTNVDVANLEEDSRRRAKDVSARALQGRRRRRAHVAQQLRVLSSRGASTAPTPTAGGTTYKVPTNRATLMKK